MDREAKVDWLYRLRLITKLAKGKKILTPDRTNLTIEI
jgi:hypothetical protein